MINIRVKDTTGKLISIVLDSNAAVKDLRQAIADGFDLKVKFDMVWGYPPIVCNLQDDEKVNMQQNELIRVQLISDRGQQAEGVGGMNRNNSTKTKAKSTSTSKISTTKSSSSSSSSSSSNKLTFGGRVATLSGSNSSASQTKKRTPQSSAFGSAKRPRKSAIKNKEESSGDGVGDICTALMAAAEGGTGGRDKALRSVFRRAVTYQYSNSLAVARLGAAFAGRYVIDTPYWMSLCVLRRTCRQD
jgi:hypothetical protein